MKDNHLLKTRPVEGGGLEAACGQRIHQMYSRDLAMLQVRGQTRSWGDISECTGAPGTIGTVRQRKATSFPKRKDTVVANTNFRVKRHHLGLAGVCSFSNSSPHKSSRIITLRSHLFEDHCAGTQALDYSLEKSTGQPGLSTSSQPEVAFPAPLLTKGHVCAPCQLWCPSAPGEATSGSHHCSGRGSVMVIYVSVGLRPAYHNTSPKTTCGLGLLERSR
ncbi:uncharacterized protein [Patagioenas fasciata]|uniref:uncharacterized protein isoform X1 n=1 Tax=Patagioenas fasciata TaxID=372321 RepID=UPI003A99C220